MSGGSPAGPDLTAAVAAAVRAPSLHNSQPWRFSFRSGAVQVRLDPTRRLPVTDPTGWAARVSGGAAVHNLRLALATQGWPPTVTVLPDRADPDLLAVVTPGPGRPATPAQHRLAAAIWRRRSHRAGFWPDPVPADARTRLVAAAREQGGWLELLVGPGPAGAVAQLAGAADQLLSRRPGYLAELSSWARQESYLDESGDGVPADAAGPPPGPSDPLPTRPYGGGHAPPRRGPEGSPLLAVLGTTGDSPGDQVLAGEVLQQVLLTATDAGLATAMVSQPIEVASIREQLRVALRRPGPPQMVLRIGYGVPGPRTPRRPVGEMVDDQSAAAGSRPDGTNGPAGSVRSPLP